MFDIDKIFPNLSPTRLFIISFVTTALFWYMDIFLFDRKLVISEPFQVSIIIALCLSFVWNLITAFITFILVHYSTPPPQPYDPHPVNEQEKGHKGSFYNILVAVILLTVVTVIQFFIEASFNRFVIGSFLLIVLIAAFLMMRVRKVNAEKKVEEH